MLSFATCSAPSPQFSDSFVYKHGKKMSLWLKVGLFWTQPSLLMTSIYVHAYMYTCIYLGGDGYITRLGNMSSTINKQMHVHTCMDAGYGYRGHTLIIT